MIYDKPDSSQKSFAINVLNDYLSKSSAKLGLVKKARSNRNEMNLPYLIISIL